MANTTEHQRLQAHRSKEINWKQWGPYLSERAWGTVREDYSAYGTAWDYFPHDHARSKAYRWGEDGIAGISDDRQYLCFGLAMWNGQDPILKERLFGLTGNEGNHGEDVKEYYYYLDSTPTHSYMKMLYKYPQREFPYKQLVEKNGELGYHDFEYELFDTGVYADNRYFDVEIEYAKAAHDDILIRITVHNRAATDAPITLLPTLWFRNTWSWGYERGPRQDVLGKPTMSYQNGAIIATHPSLGTYHLYATGADEIAFTENETNFKQIFGSKNASPYVKDAFHRYIIAGEKTAINSANVGTKAAPIYRLTVPGGAAESIELRLTASTLQTPFDPYDSILNSRLSEANEFYKQLHATTFTDDEKNIQRQALAGMLWSKQLFYYDIEQWLAGDPTPSGPPQRRHGRNRDWEHLNNFDIISMPDKWEYPWYAGWDLAFHCIPLAMVDIDFAKEQLLLLTREWYMHPNGQLPAYEWAFGDVNPPVHAWAAWRVYEMDGRRDITFLKRIFNKMGLNFTWWVNRKDADGNNIFQGGFLGLDNISLFDRSATLPTGGHLDQSDGTAWMGFFSLTMFNIAIELAKQDSAYEDMAIKYFQHFLQIAVAMSGAVRDGVGLWDEQDGFYYDVLHLPDGTNIPLRVRSLVGLMPLISITTIGQETLDKLPDLARSMDWLSTHRPHLTGNLICEYHEEYGNAHVVAIPTPDRIKRILHYMLDEDEFLSPHGIRSLSKYYEDHPYSLTIHGNTYGIEYWPAEGKSGLFGGNSNWRGPIWFPINYLLIESLRIYHRYYGDDLHVECPTGSGKFMTLDKVADEIACRLTAIFARNEQNERPVYGGNKTFQNDPHWQNLILFHEFFHGDNGAGLGASHQTGWTGLVANLMQQMEHRS